MSLLSHFRTEICPYCFEPFRLGETPFRCTSPPARCEPEIDEVRRDTWRDQVPMGKVLPPIGFFPDSARCDACDRTSRRRLCPQCHMELPRTLGRFKSLVFAVIGAKETGKSHYIAVLIEELRQTVGPRLGVLLEPLDDMTIRRYRELFYEPVYRKGETIRGTPPGMAEMQRPLVYTLTFQGKTLLGRPTIRAVVSLVFFDTAGEDLDDEDTLATVNKYIFRSDGLLLLLDPLQLSRVRDRLETATPLPNQNTETREILSRTTNLIQNGRGLSPKSMIRTPLAVAFSKFDAVEDLLDPQLQLNADADHSGGYDHADFEAVNAEMQTLLTEWHGQGLVHQVSTRFERYAFFGLSALGCNPHGTAKIPAVLPRRVEDPFLWLLHQHGLIKARKDR